MNSNHLFAAISYTFANEGVWSNHSWDKGKETIYGISRVYHPDLKLWDFVDSWDKQGDPPTEILKLVTKFYESELWVPMRLEEVADVLPDIAYSVFDSAVHNWIKIAATHFQQTLNFLNRNGEVCEDLKVDGLIGLKTISALKAVIKARPRALSEKLIVNTYGIIRGNYYLEKGNEDLVGFITRIRFL